MACYLFLLFTIFYLFFYEEKHTYSAVLKHALEQLVEYGYPNYRRKQNEQLVDDINYFWNGLQIVSFSFLK